MLTIQQIISEADIHVPNAFDTPQKVMWLNEVNNEQVVMTPNKVVI